MGNVEEGSTYEASLQNDISPRKQDDSEQFEKSDESQNKNMTLDKGKPIVDSNDEYQESVELENLENQENQFDEISSSSSIDVREHDIENINEKNDDENDKVTVNDDVININEGDEENNVENERSVVDTEDDNSAVSNITLGNDDLMSNVLADVLNVEEGSTYGASLQNDISPRKQDDSEQFEKLVDSQNKNMTLDKGKPIVGSNDEYQESVELENLENQFDEISSSSSIDVREHDIENINEKNDDENDKVTVNDDVININKGDEENNEENERSVVDTEDDNSAVSNITLGNDDLMSNVLADVLNVEEGST